MTLTDNANGTVIADAVKLVATSGGTTSEVVRYLHTDHLNTPRLATNAQAQVIWRWEGTAFGDSYPNEDVDGDGKVTTVNLRFPGQYYDQETGLHYNWNRYYDPKVGRYVTSDLIGLEGGLNTYAYVGDNPLRWTDPGGLDNASGGSWNGNWTPGFEKQDGDRCTVPQWLDTGLGLNSNRCRKKCCVDHDACYTLYGCNASSWGNLVGPSLGANTSCSICNIKAVICVIKNYSNNECECKNAQ